MKSFGGWFKKIFRKKKKKHKRTDSNDDNNNNTAKSSIESVMPQTNNNLLIFKDNVINSENKFEVFESVSFESKFFDLNNKAFDFDIDIDDEKVHNDINFIMKSEKYELGATIGEGSEGYVKKAIHIVENKMYAIKIVNLRDTAIIPLIENEIDIQNILVHPNIILIKESFIDNGNKTLWIVMEIAENGSLKDIMKKFYLHGIKDEVLLATITKQLLFAVEYCHSNKKIHRDIKSSNIMVSRGGVIKLGDFGIATTLNTAKKHTTFVGTLCWLPPEIISNKEYDEKVDIWAIGITVLELAFGVPVYHGYTPTQIMTNIINNPPPSCSMYYKDDENKSYIFSKDFESFLSKCLNKNPEHRHSADQLLKHRFIQRAETENYIRENINGAKSKYTLLLMKTLKL